MREGSTLELTKVNEVAHEAQMAKAAQYVFGDSDLAAQRLKILADAFVASTRAFVIDAAKSGLRLAADAGCGPGYTTHLLRDALQCERVVGLDNSEHFLELAKRTATANVSFQLHDVTGVPFPVGPCDLIYARFLLTHQREPEAVIAKWATQLRPGGRLLAEEVDFIYTQDPVFTTYLRVVEAMLADRGHNLYIGASLDAMAAPHTLAARLSRITRVQLTNELAARMFSLNIRTWQHDPFVQRNYSPASVRQLKKKLADLAARASDERGIEWGLRQIVYEREK